MAQQQALLAERYQIGRLLGSGGFGAVYLATDERLHRPVAIKVCSTNRLPAHEASEAARLFQSEALTLARLRHPGLTAIWDYFHQDNEWYLVMEYVPGETLRDLLRRVGGPLPRAEAVEYARQLCTVLGYLHRQQPPIVFRDLKPGNIMVTPEGQLKLIDFGIARLFSPGKVADTSQFGTPGYAPPEQYGGQTEPRSDIYSLGVVLHQMLTGHNPTASPFALPPARSLNSTLPEHIETLITQATAYDLHQRVPTADEFCNALDRTIVHGPSYTAPIARVPSQPTQVYQTGPTTSRPVWSPTPRALPSRPQTSHGMWRGIALIVLLMLLLGSLGVGAYLLKSQIAYYSRQLLDPLVVPAARSAALPTRTIFSGGQGDNENLYLILDGETPRALTAFSAPIKASQPAISPDGKRVAFTRVTPTTSEVWVMDIDGRNQQRVALDYSFARSPEWAPNNTQLAVEVAEAGKAMSDNDIVIVDLQTGTTRPLVTSRAFEGGPTWSPDGTRIAYHAVSSETPCMQLFVVDVQTGVTSRLTDLRGEQCPPGSAGGDNWPHWSPDGKQIAFRRKLNGQERLAILTLADKRIETLNTGSLPARYPRWSPDGRYLLFEQQSNGQSSLARYDLRTTEVSKINTGYNTSRLADWR